MSFDLLNMDGHSKRGGFSNSYCIALPAVQERSRRIEERHIDTAPFKILDAPGLIDDFYLNILDWDMNKVTVALGDTVYCYEYDTQSVNEIYKSEDSYITSLKGHQNKLAIGDSNGKIFLYDYDSQRISQTLSYHDSRVSALCFNDRCITSGDKTGKISNLDLRTNVPSILRGHTQEVCGLKWSPAGEYLASGSNDNTVRIWRHGSPISKVLKGHESAVKALDWCPWKTNYLATGGGTKDKSIKFWDVESGRLNKSTAVNSQVSSIIYSSRYKEMITGHGFQNNDIKLWKATDMRLISSFGSHESRVLHMALSPDQCTLVSLGADESLKFWKIAEQAKKEYKRESIGFR